MQLSELLNSVHTIQVTGEIQRKDVSGIYYDSRNVKENSVFAAVKGFNTDGHKFILDAVNKGAIAVILEDKNAVPDNIFDHSSVAKILVHDSRKALAEISNYFYKEPSKKIKLIGITGTNGKTTVSYFVKSILETAGNKVGLVGTIANYIGTKKIESQLTTPESNDLNELLLKMLEQNCTYAVMEVSSHSLVLNRVYGLNFAAGVFTNITSDHLDFHKTLDKYFSAKKILFDSLSEKSISISNVDDENGKAIVKDSVSKKYFYGTVSSDFQIKDINFDLSGTRFSIKYSGRGYSLSTSLIGEFNAYNAAAAFAVTVKLGIHPQTAIEGIKNTPHVPGRFEIVGSGAKKVVVDYSHTADSLGKALINLRKIVGNATPIYTVFGCGGNRDKTKRPVMGKIATELSEKVIVTDDNPRFENSTEIINNILRGINKDNYLVLADREEAIKTAIRNSEPDAVILIAGKGHEDYQIVNGVKHHFSDKEVAEKYL
jgi:UDP-N-acetylmuramoyl-L-alanyl-D-glutamate--2,6-diaminopimelate ligase